MHACSAYAQAAIPHCLVQERLAFHAKGGRGLPSPSHLLKMINVDHFGNLGNLRKVHCGCRLQLTARINQNQVGDRPAVVSADGMSDSEHHRCLT